MGGEWREVTIDDIAEKIAMGPFGSDIKTDNFVSSGVPVIRGTNLRSGRFLAEGFVFLTKEKADQLASANTYAGDIVFTHRGTLGQVSLIPDDGPFKRYVISQSQMKLTCDKDQAVPAFIYYFFKSPMGQHALLLNTSQTGVPAISRPVTSLKAISLLIPPIPEQRAIADFLGSLDDKIELNRRTNRVLEDMARAIFKAWFIDFMPVRWKAAQAGNQPSPPAPLPKVEGGDPAAYFGMPQEVSDQLPDRFTDSELGPVPEGWKVGCLADITEHPRRTVKPVNMDGKTPYVGLEHMPQGVHCFA